MKRWLQVKTDAKWKKGNTIYLRAEQNVVEAGQVMKAYHVDYVPVVNNGGEPIGVVTMHAVLAALLEKNAEEKNVADIMEKQFITMYPTTHLTEMMTSVHDCFVMIDDDGKLVGTVTREDMLQYVIDELEMVKHYDYTSSILKVILESAYEGIAVVDKHGMLIEFNESYARFTGVSRDEAIGRHVTDVIDNTKLHQTVKNAIPERNVLQHIQGQDMIVHRIPIWQGNQVIGAIGMLIFEGVSEVYHVYRKLQMEKESLRENIKQSNVDESMTMDQIIGKSDVAAGLKRLARKASQTEVPVLISGEKGTGKKMFARSIHQLSPVAEEAFIHFDCSAYAESLLEAELFGTPEKVGVLAKEAGTLFLEHVEQMPPRLQQKLFTIVQTKEVENTFNQKITPFRLRLIVSTTTDAKTLLHAERQSSELDATIPKIHLHIPPLRNRKEDITFLLSYYAQEFCYKYHTSQKMFTSHAVDALINYDWQGNVEELIHVVEHIVRQVESIEIDVRDLPKEIQFARESSDVEEEAISWLDQIKDKKKEKEKQRIIAALEETGGNKSQAANVLGMHRTTLYKKLKEYEIERI